MLFTIRPIYHVAAIAALTVAAACAPDFGTFLSGEFEITEFTLNVSGVVVRADNGAPVKGAVVEGVWFAERLAALTDSAGRYAMAVRANSHATFMAHLDGFQRGLEPQVQSLGSFAPSDSPVTAVLDFSLRPTRPIAVTIHGRVTDGPTAAPLRAATIVVREGLWPLTNFMDSTKTDSLGMYRIVAADHCGVANDSCFVSLLVSAQHGSRSETSWPTDIDVPGDSLDLPLSFATLR